MKFLSGARSRTACYVVEAQRQIMDMATGRSQTTPPLRAKFKDHKFDSEIAQRELGWSEEQRKRVEEHLIHHPDFGRSDGRGLFYDNSATISEAELVASGARRRCVFMQDVGEETLQCAEMVDEPGVDYCSLHLPIVIAASTGKGAGQEVARNG